MNGVTLAGKFNTHQASDSTGACWAFTAAALRLGKQNSTLCLLAL